MQTKNLLPKSLEFVHRELSSSSVVSSAHRSKLQRKRIFNELNPYNPDSVIFNFSSVKVPACTEVAITWSKFLFTGA